MKMVKLPFSTRAQSREKVEGLGSDKTTKGRAIRFALIFGLGVFLSWNLLNVPAEQFRATAYIVLSVFFFIGVFYDIIFKKKEYIDTILEEPKEKMIIPVSRKWIFVLGIIITVFFTYRIVTLQQAIVDAPKFQIAEFTQNPYWGAFLSGLVGLVENAFFFSLIFPTIAANIGSKVGSSTAGAISAIILASMVFLGYHFFVYGLTDIAASQAVLFFGIVNCIIVYVFRSIIVADLWHFSNNFFIALAQTVSVSLRVITG